MCLTNSALRRNVAEHLGIATAADIKARRRALSREEADEVNAWIRRCELTWMECDSEEAACECEEVLKHEFLPLLAKM